MTQGNLFDGARTRLMPRSAKQKALGRAKVNDGKKAEALAWFEHLKREGRRNGLGGRGPARSE